MDKLGGDIMNRRRMMMNDKIVSAQGENFVINNVKSSKLNGLNIYGKSKQDGTPTPDNPVPIVSAGDEGEINVTVQGGNLFDSSIVPKTTRNGITFEWLPDEKCFLLNGTSIEGGIPTYKVYFNLPVKKGATYTVSAYYVSGEAIGAEPNGYAYFGAADKPNESNNWRTAWLTNDKSIYSAVCNYDYITAFWFYIQSSGVTFNNYKVRVMLSAGSTPLPYMPYKQPQTLTAQTPGGLPGIPVSSGGNYTDENGQQWICDEVDFKRGVYVQRVWKGTFDGSEDENWIVYGKSDSDRRGFACLAVLLEELNRKDGLSNQFVVGGAGIAGEDIIWIGVNNKNIYALTQEWFDKGVDAWKAHLAAHPLEVMTYLETPIETDLSDEEIAAYKALHTYSPATTVSNDTDTILKIRYREYKN